MANFITTKSTPLSSSIALRSVNILEAGIKNIVKWNKARIARKELYALSDRELNDIGITRADINKLF